MRRALTALLLLRWAAHGIGPTLKRPVPAPRSQLFEACAIIVAATRWLLRRPPLDEPRPAVLRRRRRRLARDLESGGGTPPACDSAGAVRPQQQQREEGEEEGEEEVVEVHHITNQPTAGEGAACWAAVVGGEQDVRGGVRLWRAGWRAMGARVAMWGAGRAPGASRRP